MALGESLWHMGFGRMALGEWFWGYGFQCMVGLWANGFGRRVLGAWFWTHGFGPIVLGMWFGGMMLGAQPCKQEQAKLRSIYPY